MRASDERPGEDQEGEAGEDFGEGGGTVRRGRGGGGGNKEGRNLGRRHSRASSLDRREIYQKYIHTDRSVHFALKYILLFEVYLYRQFSTFCIEVY